MSDRWFYVNDSGDTIGPVASKALKQLVKEGFIKPTTILISEDGTQEFEARCASALFGHQPGISDDRVTQTRSLTPVRTAKTLPLAPGQQTAKTTLPAPPPEMPLAPGMAFDAGIPMPITLHSEGEKIVRIKRTNWFDNALIWSVLGLGVLFLFGSVLVSFTWRMAVQHTAEMENRLPKYEEESTAQKNVLRGMNREDDTNEKKPATLEDVTAQVEESIAQIEGAVSCGTGFVVSPGIVATSSHVVASEKIESVMILFPAREGQAKGPFKPKLLYEDTVRDITLLGIEETMVPPLPIHDNYAFRRAQRILTIGNPGRGDGVVLENAVSAGILSTQTEVDGVPFYQLSIAVNPGNSGGPVLDEEGRVIGMISLKSVKSPSMAFCIPVEELAHAMGLEKNLTAKERREMDDAHLMVVGQRQGQEPMDQGSIFEGSAWVESSQSRNGTLKSSTDETDQEPSFSQLSESDQEKLMEQHQEQRYRQILAKEKWTFNGTPLFGTIVGFKNGIVFIRLKDSAEDEPPLERYARRFSAVDINDIMFYARYHGIPTGNLGRR